MFCFASTSGNAGRMEQFELGRMTPLKTTLYLSSEKKYACRKSCIRNNCKMLQNRYNYVLSALWTKNVISHYFVISMKWSLFNVSISYPQFYIPTTKLIFFLYLKKNQLYLANVGNMEVPLQLHCKRSTLILRVVSVT